MRKLCVLLLLLPLAVYGGEIAKVGTVGSQFLKIGVGARGAAMGGAFDAVSSDISAVFWNPSGLVHVEGTSVYLSHIEWLADINYEALAVAKSFGEVGVFGLYVTYLNSGDIEETTMADPEGTGNNFYVDDMMLGISYARRLTDKFAFGANLKMVREKLDEDISTAWATDLGITYYTGFKSMRLGMSIRNFGPEIQLSGSYRDYDNGVRLPDEEEFLPYHFPMTFKLGVAMELVDTPDNRLTLAADLEHPNDNLERFNLGAEAYMWKTFSLRGGYTLRHDTAGPAFGAGFMWQKMSLDYAYTDYGILDWVHRFDFIFNL